MKTNLNSKICAKISTLKYLVFFTLAHASTNFKIFAAELPYNCIPAFGKTWKESSFDKPVAVVEVPSKNTNKTEQVAVVEKTGKVILVDLEKSRKTLFIDLSENLSLANEEGLLDIAFHPKFQQNRAFFTFRCLKIKGRKTNRLSRFTANNTTPLTANPNSEIILIDQKDRAGNHNGGELVFGADGYLYISVGDEGRGGDSLKNAQKIDHNFFAGILRIDVDKKADSLAPNPHQAISRNEKNEANYRIPADNPFVNISTKLNHPDYKRFAKLPEHKIRTEFYAIGLRNVWRFCFDAKSGTLWAADVGQGKREEINLITPGGNYGWAWREGKIPYYRKRGKQLAPPKSKFIEPIWDYPRDQGASITGGIFYHGAKFPKLQNSYLFGDYSSGKIWSLKLTSNKKAEVAEISKCWGVSAFALDPRDQGVLLANYNKNRIEKLALNRE